jgi:ubiquinone biosynthesis protein
MFCVGEFHGDLHPGNVLLNGNDFYFVDTGYVGSIGPVVRDGLFRFFGALSDYDYAACVTHLHAMSTKQLGRSRLQRFEKDFLALYADFRGSTVSEVSLTRKMMQTIRLSVNAGMAFDRSIFSIIRSLMYLDGMVMRCNPDAVLMRDMRPLLDEFLAVSSTNGRPVGACPDRSAAFCGTSHEPVYPAGSD